MINKNNLPKHIAIIMDGNGRWAKKRNLPRTEGHRRGIKVVEDIVEAAAKDGIKVLSLYAFSTENWNRPKKEIDMLMAALANFLRHSANKLIKNNIKLLVMGDLKKFPQSLQDLLSDIQKRSERNSGLIVNLALNYGSRYEIVTAVKNIINEVNKGNLSVDNIDEETFSKFLYTKDLPDPDLLIRTSGEIRISNFMLWQLSYAELYFCKKFWPDFTKKDLENAIKAYQRRERRFGKTHAVTTLN